MRIDRNLKLVIPVEIEPEELDAKGEVVRPATNYYVHATPVSEEVFEEHAFLFGRAFNKTLQAGVNLGPRLASLMLKEAARESYGEDDKRCGALLAEIRRMCTVVVPTDKGFEPVPLEEALRRGTVEKSDVSRVEGGIVFFTLSWHILSPSERKVMIYGATANWGGSTTSSNATDFARSLRTSTPAASTGATAPGTVTDETGRASSLPS